MGPVPVWDNDHMIYPVPVRDHDHMILGTRPGRINITLKYVIEELLEQPPGTLSADR